MLQKIWNILAPKLTIIFGVITIFLLIYTLILNHKNNVLQEKYIKLQISYNEKIIAEINKAITSKRDSVTIIQRTIIDNRKEAEEKKDEIDGINSGDSLITRYYELRPKLAQSGQ